LIFLEKNIIMLMQKYKFMDQISQSNLTNKKLVECSSNKVSLETELSETLYNTMKDFVLNNTNECIDRNINCLKNNLKKFSC